MENTQYRAWNKRTESMNYFVEITCYTDGSTGWTAGENDNYPAGGSDDFELNQYIGLNDIKGVRIFEHDIIKIIHPHKVTYAEVVRGDRPFENTGFYVSANENWVQRIPITQNFIDMFEVEVVGNKYKNEELLKLK